MLWVLLLKISFFKTNTARLHYKLGSCGHFDVCQAFAHYLAYRRDNNELLLFILKQLATEQINFNMNGYGVEQDVIEVCEEEFTERVRGGGATQLTLPLRCHGNK
ncbi:hypothetical protein EMCRGX_G001773 [Ephydatia muelleri]